MNMIKYVIKWGNYYFEDHISNQHWVDCIDDARQFHSMTIALGYAVMKLDLKLEDFTIEPVVVQLEEYANSRIS